MKEQRVIIFIRSSKFLTFLTLIHKLKQEFFQNFIKQKIIDSLIIQSLKQILNRKMSIYRNQYENLGDNTYNSIKSNYGTYQQRSSFRNPSQRPGSYNDVAPSDNYKQTNSPPRRNSIAKLNDIRKRVHEVIDLCKGENVDVKGQLNQVISEERQIYNLLSQNPQVLQRTVSNPSIVQQNQNLQQTIPYRQSFKNQQTITPYRLPKQQYVPQSQYYIPNFSQVGNKQNNYPPNISHSNVLRPQSGNLHNIDPIIPLQQPFSTLGGIENVNGLHNSINRLKNTKQIQLNDDALKLIEQIQRKAFEQIQKLRRQKLQLMQRLNQQIRNVNEQRKRTLQLQSALSRYNLQSQRPDGTLNNQVHNSNYLQSQISRLENQLYRANQLNNNLRLQLAHRGSGVPGIQQLLRQGEAIRQQTLRLVKLKQTGDNNQRIEDLQRRLASQQAQKQNALNQIAALKQRFGQTSQRGGYQQNVSYQKSTARVKQLEHGKSVGQYEDLVSQMKRITGF